MLHRQRFLCLLLALSCLVSATGVRAADVVDNVPRNALGFVVVRDLAAIEAQIRQAKIGLATIGPSLALLQAMTGPETGVDTHGEFLVAFLTGGGPLSASPLGVWVPVRDYDQFTRALGGDPQLDVTVITVLGEDLLCGRRGAWALVMDPDQRSDMDRILAGESAPPPQIAAWRDWLRKNSIAVVALPTPEFGQALNQWAGERNVRPQGPLDDLFGVGPGRDSSDSSLMGYVRQAVRGLLAGAPKLTDQALGSNAVALGLQIDERGNLVAGVRMAWPNEVWSNGSLPSAINGGVRNSAPVLHRDAEFAVSGSGAWPKDLLVAAADAAARQTVAGLRNEPSPPKFDEGSVGRFREACEQAATQVQSVALYHTLGAADDGVYTNYFAAVDVASAAAFVAQIDDVVRRWNEINETAEPNAKESLDRQQTTVAGRPATQYSLDVLAAEGFTDTAELRQSMQQFFGPSGKFHLFAVSIDEHTVLLAQATADQTAAALTAIEKQGPGWKAANTSATNRLLPESADWRFFVSPSGYTKWLKRESQAVLGGAIGAPNIEEFPAAPPIGWAGGFSDRQLWIDAVVPAETMKAAAPYLKSVYAPR